MTEIEATEAGYEVGSIKWFNDEKGYGFIVPDLDPRGRGDAFLHASKCRDIRDDLIEGVRVAFKVSPNSRKLAATEVHLIGDHHGR